ncbi:MAG: hypothetical protein QXU44_09715, partial [Candidatus Caldarchaeum sp.]
LYFVSEIALTLDEIFSARPWTVGLLTGSMAMLRALETLLQPPWSMYSRTARTLTPRLRLKKAA